MSQLAHPARIRTMIHAHRVAVVAALIALAATTAVVLVLVIGDDSSTAQAPIRPAAVDQSVRPDAGPVPPALNPATNRPDESNAANWAAGR